MQACERSRSGPSAVGRVAFRAAPLALSAVMLGVSGGVEVASAAPRAAEKAASSAASRAAPKGPPKVAPLAADALELELGGGVRLELVLVRAGEFRQGSPASEAGRGADEAAREVTLTRDYYIGKYEVTVEQYGAFVEATGYSTETERGTSGGFGFDGKKLTKSPRYSWRDPGYAQTPQHPVSLVTFGDAVEFTRWLSELAEREVQLPSEAEWEHAYRAGTRTRFYAGARDAVATQIGWLKTNAPGGARPVGGREPNALGIHDMAGNVYEWCRDWYGPYVPGDRATDPELDEPPPGEVPRRVLRGGSFLRAAKDARAAARYRNDPGSRNADNGFRVVAATQLSPALGAAARGSAGTSRADAPTPMAPGAPGSSLSTASTSSGWSPLRLGIIAVASVFGAGVCFSLFRGLSRRGRGRGRAGRSLPADVMLKPTNDGFFVIAPEKLRGHTLVYRITGPSGVERAEVMLEHSSSGQFVYTGYRPSAVSAEQVIVGGAAAWSARRARREEDDYDYDEPVSAAPSTYRRRFPSAY